ncbi:MAG: hypothetical protein KAT26_01000, partial [Marinosulfonomonas sp.]|nr:hypothetical protein [Marinosulfonomonas sp.]
MQIGAITQVLIRMELDHVSEWLLHMQKLGFDKIWVFYEEQVVDARVGQDSPSPNWAKKPEADFHPELSDEEALQKFQEIIDQIHGIDIFLIPSTSRAEHNGKRQIDNLIWLCKKIQTKEFPLIDWLAFLDIDELIVCKQPLKSYLSNPSQKRVSVINIPQRLMASRWEG